MIKFKCSNCNHQINAPEKYAGKRVRCPKCKAPIRVPKSVPNTGTQEPKLIKFRCPSCNQKIGLAQHYAGKRVRCAKCKQPLRVPELQAEAVDSGPASEEGRIDDMFDDDIGSGGMFDDKMLTDELLTFEGGAPAVEETPALKPLSPRMWWPQAALRLKQYGLCTWRQFGIGNTWWGCLVYNRWTGWSRMGKFYGCCGVLLGGVGLDSIY